MAAKDFTADQIRTSKLIVSGSRDTGHKNLSLTVYERSGASDVQGGISDSEFYNNVGEDVHIFISGSQESRDGTDGGAVLFGGDTYISGTLVVSDTKRNDGGSISGSIHHTSAGSSYLVADVGIQITSASNGQITIRNTVSNDVLESLAYYDEYNGTPTHPPFAEGEHTVAIGNGAYAGYRNSHVIANFASSSGQYSGIFGGFLNTIMTSSQASDSRYNMIVGGYSNILSSSHSSIIAGGEFNYISGSGAGNAPLANNSGIFGGKYNNISGSTNTILGGQHNKIEKSYVTLIGQHLTSSATGEVIIGFGESYDGGGIKTTIISGSNFISDVTNIAVFNESGGTADFRIEGNSTTIPKAGAILVDGGTNQVIIQGGGVSAAKSFGTNAATKALPVDVATFISGACIHPEAMKLPVKRRGVTLIHGDLVVSGTISQIPCDTTDENDQPEGLIANPFLDTVTDFVNSQGVFTQAAHAVSYQSGQNSRGKNIKFIKRFSEETNVAIGGDLILRGKIHGTSPVTVTSSGSSTPEALAVSGSVSIVASGSGGANFSLTGSMNVTGSLTVSGSNTLTVYGPSIFNADQNANNDFQVKSSTNANMFYVDSSTNRIGVGTASPSTTVHVNKASGENELRLQSNNKFTSIIQKDNAELIVQNASAGPIIFYDDSAETMRIEAGGEVGIGVSDPDAQLEVLKAGTQFKLSYDGSNSTTFAVGSSGDLTVNASGGDITLDDNVTVSGNLVVNGTTATVNTTNLTVDDPIIVMAHSSSAGNTNGGIAILSGSNTADQAMVFGRVANDTWGVGRKDIQDGDVTTLSNMTLTNIRAAKLEVGGTSDTIDVVSSDLTLVSGQDIQLKPNSGNSDVIITGDVIPGADDTYDLGSSSAAWQDLHLEGDILMTDAGNIETAAGDLTIKTAADGASRVILSGSSGADSILVQSEMTVTGNLLASAKLKLGGNEIQNSEGENTIELTADQKVGIGGITPSHMLDVNGDIRIRGNDIRDNGGDAAITFDGSANTTIAGDLTVAGGDIIGPSGADLIIKSANNRVILSGSSADDSVLIQSDLEIDGKTFINEDVEITANKKIFFDGASINNGPFIYGNTTTMFVDGDNFLNLYYDTQTAFYDGNAKAALLLNNEQVLIMSGGAATSIDEGAYPDVALFVSGAVGSKGTSAKGVALFGGDVVISGTLHGGSPLNIGSNTEFGIEGAGVDVTFFGDTSNVNMIWDQSRDSLAFTDDAKIELGNDDTNSMMTITNNGTRTEITNGTSAGHLRIDNQDADKAIKVILGSDTSATDFRVINNSENTSGVGPLFRVKGDGAAQFSGDLDLKAGDLSLKHDGALLMFGGDEEIAISHIHNEGLVLTNTVAPAATAGAELTLESLNQGAGGALDNGDRLGVLHFAGNDTDNGNNPIVGARIQAFATQDWTTSANNCKMVFSTTTGNFNVVDALEIDENQDVSFITDDATLKFGANKEISLKHHHNKGLSLSSGGTQTAEALVGTDAILYVSGTIPGQFGGGKGIASSVVVLNSDLVVSGAYRGGYNSNGGYDEFTAVAGNYFLVGSDAGLADAQAQAADTNFFVSGAINSMDTGTRGTSAFGGDLVTSGNFYAKEIAGGTVHTYSPAGSRTFMSASQFAFVSNLKDGAVVRDNGLLHYELAAPAGGKATSFGVMADIPAGATRVKFTSLIKGATNNASDIDLKISGSRLTSAGPGPEFTPAVVLDFQGPNIGSSYELFSGEYPLINFGFGNHTIGDVGIFTFFRENSTDNQQLRIANIKLQFLK